MFERLFTPLDEALLIERAKDDQRSFARLYDLYADTVYHFVRWKTSSDQDAEDIVSETFMAVALRIRDFDKQKGTFKTWLLTIAQYKFLDKMRKVYVEKELHIDSFLYDPSYETDFAELLTNEQLYKKIIDFVHALSDRQSTIFFLRYVEELSNKEIASICDVHEKTVSSTLCHVCKKVAKVLGVLDK